MVHNIEDLNRTRKTSCTIENENFLIYVLFIRVHELSDKIIVFCLRTHFYIYTHTHTTDHLRHKYLFLLSPLDDKFDQKNLWKIFLKQS